MPTPDTIAGWLFTVVKMVGSAITGPDSAVAMGGIAPVADAEGTNSEDGQASPAFGAPALVWRPRPPSKTDDGHELTAEAVSARIGEGVIPLAWRDLRFNRRFPAPKEGTIAMVGYGGGFMSFDDIDADTKDGTVETIYCPYEFSDGTPGKAHAIVLDPKQKTVTLVHGAGHAIIMTDDGILMKAGASTFLQIKDGSIDIVANTVNARGNVALGANTMVAVPALPGIAFPGSTSVFVSP